MRARLSARTAYWWRYLSCTLTDTGAGRMTVRQCVVTVCRDSVTVCRDSVTVCRDSLTVRRDSVTV